MWPGAIAVIFGLLAASSWMQRTSDGIAGHGWMFDLAVIAWAGLVGLIYAMGVARGATSTVSHKRWRHVAFAAGIATVLVALEPPLGALARQFFLARQIQDLLLGIVAPILIVIATPRAALISGLTGESRSSETPYLIDDMDLRADSFRQNAGATAFAIMVLFVWLYPPFQNAAVTSSLTEMALNVTTFGAAFVFWSLILDFRPLPAGAGYGSRLMMLWIMALSHIVIGTYLTMKTEILYSAYGAPDALGDETVGGFIIWVPSALLCLAAIIMVIHLWGRHEDRVWAKYSGWSSSNSAAMLFPTTGEQLIALARPKNRALAISLTSFVIAAFGLTIFGGILSHINNERGVATPVSLVAQHSTAIHRSTE